jgi:hypothetical protein
LPAWNCGAAESDIEISYGVIEIPVLARALPVEIPVVVIIAADLLSAPVDIGETTRSEPQAALHGGR